MCPSPLIIFVVLHWTLSDFLKHGVCFPFAAHSLVCFTCKDASSNRECLGSTTSCPNSGKHFNLESLSLVSFSGSGGNSGQSISKGCASVCPSSGVNIGIAAASVSCCSSFLCKWGQQRGASSVKVSYSVLAMAILASFVYIRAGL
uniref:UPAR/Ly6 domain-containing protein n=1 Tax=Terrapene triunguis TaxID=2587831 RepID=A0A674IVP4_9SAUR